MIYMLPPVLPTPAIKKTDELLKVKRADGKGGGSLTTGSIVNGRVNDSFALFLVLGGN